MVARGHLILPAVGQVLQRSLELARMMGQIGGGAAIAVERFHFALSLARLMAYIVVTSLPSELYEEPEPLELLPEPLEPLPSWLSDSPEPPYC